MKLDLDSTLGRRLSMFMSMESKILVELKSSEQDPFICKARDFDFGEEDTRVEFTGLKETIFPTDTDENKPDSFTMYMNEIKSVERIR